MAASELSQLSQEKEDKKNSFEKDVLQKETTEKENGNENEGFDLGLEEKDVPLKRPRKKIAKFDEERLASENGIPKLQQLRKKVNLKGKGHELGDLKRILSMYHVWTHELYPRATFDDSIAYLNRLGSMRSVKVRRRGWINEISDESVVGQESLQDLSYDQPFMEPKRFPSNQDSYMENGEDASFVIPDAEDD
ncbi:replication fork protection complex subunit Swi3 [Schizosaccharomyces cryophilus OY26]|uniref:Chromosome segregation in meiosis protein n=1 Tax=Schizosaccharomyces cryophilus (strain OY26 / ATCC MYA-4695 / CBS 11777 / NBRC 106824 / NRRL Y48691) TaxID=653667 RepID=S9XA28_SCHCR|nr:replication fork protection complex subunit Swi3 [Schizosaccharomyces cryophilus OY26]EPY53987.1 replication fork protection complex subunit Swi3 [Schizosaccharomyces cryophilus OY26]